MDLIANKTVRYAGTQYQPGDPLTVPDRHGKILVAIKKAKPADSLVVVAKAPPKKVAIKKAKPYKRRDMTAEQSGD